MRVDVDGVVERHSNSMHIIAVIHISIVWCFSSNSENDKYKRGARRVSFDTFLIYVHVLVAADEHLFLFFIFFAFFFPRPSAMAIISRQHKDSMLNSGTGIS